MQPHAKIVSALRSGDAASALAEIERQLAAEPRDSDLLGLKGLALALGGRLEDAVEPARLAVCEARAPAQRLKHAANLARLLARAQRGGDIAGISEMDLPPLAGLAEGELDATVLADICNPLLLAGKHDFVAAYLAPLLDRPDTPWEVERLWLAAAAQAKKHAEILARFNAASYCWRDRPGAIAHACSAAAALGRDAEYEQLFGAYVAAAPFYIAQRQPSQIMTVVHIADPPTMTALTGPVRDQHFHGNYPSQLGVRCAGRYRFLSVFAASPPRSAAGELDRDEPAITLNNCVNGEALKRGALAKVEAHQQALGLAVVNAAEKALHCTRVETAKLVSGVPNLIVPKAMRFRLDPQLLPALRQHIKELFAFPVILRSVGEQEGANIHLARNDAALPAIFSELIALGSKDFYVIDYAGVEHENGFHRRIRAAFVEGIPTLIRADYDDQWMVRGRKFDRILDHYRRDRALFDRANAVVEQPECLGDAAWKTLLEIGRRIPLDIFGMDFDIDSHGRVVFFESNATMLLLSNAPKDLDYPQDAERAFLARLDALFMKRAGLTGAFA
ncbi:hypothetical protein [Aestuariivirga sp.]|uniref:hypothetical protein n=1 Tax=Aestuariivirga sp. TaxID=2650926 RepID=UPI0025C6D53B|nr:hypothetical protein [Aestuariivirga sp.]MCA3554159.1 hypothetical protein [Aestuariivirga sp.]